MPVLDEAELILNIGMNCRTVPTLGSLNQNKFETHFLQPKIWGSLSLPSRFKPHLGLFRKSPGCGCRRPSPWAGPVGIEPMLIRCKSSG